MIRVAALAACALLLAACGSAPKPRPDARAGGTDVRPLRDDGAARVDELPPPPSCVPMREHDESLYTAGGLYAPGVPDRPPPVAVDVSNIPEPVPRREPRARWGNRPTYTVLGRTYRVMESAEGFVERGIASWYGYKFHGRHTSSRERYDMCAFTAAHKTLPLPSYVRVTNLENGRSVVVRVNDRGPFHEGRIIDLSYAAATRLDMKQAAERLVDQLDAAGIDGAELDHAIVDERSVWRVRFPAQALEAAERLAERIRDSGLASPRLFGAEP